MDAAGHFIFKPYPSVIQGFDAYLRKDNALNDLCGKTLVILSFYFASKKMYYLWGNMFLRDILTATIKRLRFKHLTSTAMIQTELIQGNQIYTVVLTIILNIFQSMSLSVNSTVEQK